jgi:hypothetical protein
MFTLNCQGKYIRRIEQGDKKMKDVVMGIVRHILTAVGGAVVAKGMIDAGQAEIVVGSLVALAGVAASVIEKRIKRKSK